MPKTFNNRHQSGRVYLVGAGPGDPQLITVRGLNCLRSADVIIYDRLVNKEILRYARVDAVTHYVGKKPNREGWKQSSINGLMIDEAKSGRKVVRLKGGDPILLARGGEEASSLKEAGIPYEIIPGVTSAFAGPAYAGIPVTFRNIASSVSVATGTKADGSLNECAFRVSVKESTLIVLMGMNRLKEISEELILYGNDPETPVCVVSKATTADQKFLSGKLNNIGEICRSSDIAGPAVIVIGEVSKYGAVLNWLEHMPLSGVRVMITRPYSYRLDLAERIELLGGEVLSVPAIKILPPESYSQLDEACRELHKYSMIIFTSANGVKYFFKRLNAAGKDARFLAGCKTAVIGTGTAAALKSFGVNADIMPDKYLAEGLIERLEKEQLMEKKILFPRAAEARDVLPEFLRNAGAHVHLIEAYRVVPDYDCVLSALESASLQSIDVISFTSPSCVRAFFKVLNNRGSLETADDIKFACIGPITAEAVKKEGFYPCIVSREHTVEGLLKSILEYYINPGGFSNDFSGY